ncbi:MAG TPA: hypothetical protein VLF91_03740 [Candidatus Saccharimonadales bacterium]|nr:hypothetical protein [Candidatus Saccharimonadales bacterium]
MNKNVIELNGKRYDALTGAYLGESQTTPMAAPKKPHHKGTAIDGVVRKSAAPAAVASSAAANNKPHAIAPAAHTKHRVMDVTPSRAKAAPKTAPAATPAPASQPEPSPASAVTTAVPNASADPIEELLNAEILPNPAIKPSSTTEVEIAKTANDKPAADTKLTKTEPAPAKRQTRSARHAAAHQPEHSKTLMRHAVHKPEIHLKPAIKPQSPVAVARVGMSSLVSKPSAISVDPQRLARAHQVQRHHAVRHFAQAHALVTKITPKLTVQPAPLTAHLTPATAPKQPRAPQDDIFEAAIAHATSHQQPTHRLRRSRQRKLMNTLAGSTAFLVIAAFIAFLNMPNIQLHVASIQAGFKAAIPSYIPVGYAMTGGVKRTGNTVSMAFHAGSSNYNLTEQPSNWDNQTLLDNTLALQGAHQTIEAAGRTVFIYGQNNAVWVTGNVRYDVVGNAHLDMSDISRLASSL